MNDPGRGLEIAGTIADAKARAYAWRRIAESRGEFGELSSALEWALSLSPAEARANALRGLVEGVQRRRGEVADGAK